jgi:minor extracellular serine protease Vpr
VCFLTFQVFARTRLEEYALVLQDPPVARQIASRGALHTDAAASRLRLIQTAQQNLRQELARRKIRVSGSAQTLVNAVFVRAPRERVAELRSLPGVVRVTWMPPMKRALNQAVNLVNVPTAWNILPGGQANAGAGVMIAIIDSGIDNTHPAFQDSSLQVPAGYPKGRAQDLAYTNHKIIVARNYEPLFALPDDPTPRDRSGHGTALAMIAAGNTTKGPLATITGVAPKAWLGNYKIFGSPGVNDVTYGSIVIQALEDAYNDLMDIAVLAFGYPAVYGPLDTDATGCASESGVPSQYQNACDISAMAVENAVKGGMTVVVSAGNDAQSSTQPPALNSINSPGTAPSAITVGAFTNGHVFYSAVEVQGMQNIDALVGDGPKLQQPLTATLQDVSSVNATGLACSGLPTGAFTGKIVLIERGTCDFSTKINNAAQAGAIGVVIYQSDPNALPFSSLGAENTGIPAVMIGNADGVNLKTYLSSHANTQATLDPTLHEESATPDYLTDFTSRGPSIDYNIKPELVAVGQGIYTATESLDPNGDLYDPSGYTVVNGSSFAAAMVAGAGALVLQKNPNFKDQPGKIKSALVNSASENVAVDTSNSGEALITAAGVGVLNAAAALVPGATAEPATVSFGWVGPGSTPSPVQVTVTNISSQSVTYTPILTVVDGDPDPSDVVTVSPPIQLGPGQTGAFQVSLSGNFSTAGTYDGFIDISGLSTKLTVPYWYLVSDGNPFDLMPVINSSFYGVVNDTCWLISFKVLDQFGIAVPDTPVTFSSPDGGAVSTDTSCPSDTKTDSFGIASAHVDLGSSPGDETFQASAQGLSNATADFFATVRNMPTITSISDAASFQVGKGLAPGSYIGVYGTALTDATHLLTTNFLPFSMSNASVSFWSADNSVAWPGRVWFVSPTQINVQIPWELNGWSSAKVMVTADGIYSADYTIPISTYLPAMYLYNNMAIAQDTNYQLITAANPARRGQTIIIYANGMGPVTHQPPSGEITPSTEPFSETQATPTVTIGNVNATVGFSGLTPGSIGLYQLNVTVPQNAPTGLQPVVITQGGVASQAANLPIQ